MGELLFQRGVRLKVQKEDTSEVEVDVAEDAVDEVIDQPSNNAQFTPVKNASNRGGSINRGAHVS